jgi:N utilization substance protein A
MPATIKSEFALALNQIATERGLAPEVILETIQAAVVAAYRKDYGGDELELVTSTVSQETGEIKVYKEGVEVTPPGFGRIAAQTAKQVLLQRNREAEKAAVLADFQHKIGTIVPGMILRFDGPNVVVDIGRAQAYMPVSEQNPAERYHLNQRLSFFVSGIRETTRGQDIIVSRADKGLVEGLFKREVPEVAQGAVELRIVAREAGGRTKVAVWSTQSGVDPVGSCVGQKGVRVQAVINELGCNEKVDIIQWTENTVEFIIAALAPAKDVSVTLDEATKIATVFVPEDQLSLAIGRDGQNVRLASKVTGWKIDIKGKQVVAAAVPVEEAPAATEETVVPEVVAPTEDVVEMSAEAPVEAAVSEELAVDAPKEPTDPTPEA